MELKLNRKSKNELYCEGILSSRGRVLAVTEEAGRFMLPPGRYILRLLRRSARKTVIEVFSVEGVDSGILIRRGWSWKCSLKHHAICIGEESPTEGDLVKSDSVVQRLVDVLRKHHGEVRLYISEDECVETTPHPFWLRKH